MADVVGLGQSAQPPTSISTSELTGSNLVGVFLTLTLPQLPDVDLTLRIDK